MLGLLRGLSELTGPGGEDEVVLANSIGELGAGYAKASVGQILLLGVVGCGVLFVAGLLLFICWGTCVVRSAEPSRAEPSPAAERTPAKRRRAAKAQTGTAEERRSLAADEDGPDLWQVGFSERL